MAKKLISRNTGYKGMKKIILKPKVVSQEISYPTQTEEELNDIDPDYDLERAKKAKRFILDNKSNLGVIFKEYGEEKDYFYNNLRWDIQGFLFKILNAANPYEHLSVGEIDLTRMHIQNYSPEISDLLKSIKNWIENGINLKPTISQTYIPEKESWQMTFDEFRKSQQKLFGEDYAVQYETGIFDSVNKKYDGGTVREHHYKSIKLALAEGENVPQEVLDEYPELKIVKTDGHPSQPIGNPLISDNFYKLHPENILGEQLTGQGRFGTSILVKGSIDNLSRMDIPALPEKVFTGIPESNLVDAEAGETIAQNIKKAIDSEEKKAIKKTFKIDVPETVAGEIYTFAEIVKRYNKNVSADEIQAWLYCHPELPAEKYTGKKELKLSKSDLIDKGLICYHNGAFEYKYIYASGLINKKVSLLKRDKEKITDLFGEKVWNYQLELLKSAMPKQKSLADSEDNRIVIVPHSQIALSFKIEETMSEKFNTPLNLRDAFRSYLKNTLKSTDFKQSNSDEIIKYYLDNKGVQIPGKLSDKEKDKLSKLNINIKQRTTAEGDKLFSQFLSENLLAEDRMKLEIIWNEKYNSLSPVNVSKIPVGFTMSKTFKDNKPLEISETQRNGIAFLAVKKSGVIAYDVGVGKTLTAILYASYALENGYSQYPLIIVPNNVYQKWIEDMQGYMDKEKGRFMMGAIPHYPKIRGLYNLNVDVVKTLKNYSESDQTQLDEYLEIINKATEERAKTLGKSPDYAKVSESLFKGKYGEWAKTGYEQIVENFNQQNSADKTMDDLVAGKISKPFTYTKTLNGKKVPISIAEHFLNKYISFAKNDYNFAIYDLGTIKPVAPGTISVITYEGLQKLGLRDYKDIIVQLFEILMQGDKFIEDEKLAANLYNKLEERVASSTQKAKLFMEDFLIDAFVFDEAHAAKKIFTSVKGETKGEIETDNFGNVIYDADGNFVKKVSVSERKTSSGKVTQVDREKSQYELDSGAPSARALSTYILGRYIQQNNDNRNVVLLTATPFENNPLEIYSMLSLANHQELVQNGFSSIKDFFDTFMKLEYDIKVTAKNEVKKDLVLTGFRNLPQMRAIIRNVIDYKTGEEANVIRPNKIILPDYFIHNIETRFKMSLEQSEYMKDVEQYMNDKEVSLKDICSRVWTNAEEEIEEAVDLSSMTDEERIEFLAEQKRQEQSGTKFSDDELTETDKEGVKILQGLSMMRAIALTPFYYKCKRISTEKPTAEEYVNSSPKLQYVMDCVKSVKEYHENNNSKMSGQVIYMNAAVQYFPQIAEYLTDPKFGIGYKKDEVQLIIGGMSQAQKEKIKRAFLNGSVKIIIGSKAIEVGVDLQENASCLYNLWYDWNPTTQAQIIGRIWRQGNRFANVRIVYPMCENSADPIMFQYLGEKTARIKEIWDQEGVISQLDLKDFNPDEL
jgi:superfamily II DNA or RNA helicase